MGTLAVLFDVGIVRAEREAKAVLRMLKLAPQFLIARHVSGDWGSVPWCVEVNNFSAVTAWHAPIESVYPYSLDGKDYAFLVQTRKDRVFTTIRLGTKQPQDEAALQDMGPVVVGILHAMPDDPGVRP
jgi:hypothetical protein